MTAEPPRLRVAFDLDETLGVPITDGRAIVGFQMRQGCRELLADLKARHDLILWTVSSRAYATKALGFGLGVFFDQAVTWDEMPCRWKDVRRIGVDFLVDDSDEHRQMASPYGLGSHYIVVPVYGSPEDFANPLAWAEQVRQRLLDPRRPVMGDER